MRAWGWTGSLYIICERLNPSLEDCAAPNFFLEELGPHFHLLTLDIPINIVFPKDTAVLVLLAGGIAHFVEL